MTTEETSQTASFTHTSSLSTHSPAVISTEEEPLLPTPGDTFRYQGDRVGARRLSESSSTSAAGAGRQDPHLGPLNAEAFSNRQDGTS